MTRDLGSEIPTPSLPLTLYAHILHLDTQEG